MYIPGEVDKGLGGVTGLVLGVLMGICEDLNSLISTFC